MKRIILILLIGIGMILMLSIKKAAGQSEQPLESTVKQSVQTPEVASLGKHGDLPVNLYTGGKLFNTITVNGTAKAEEVIVTENVGADFVFEEDYTLPDLSDLENFIKLNKHLQEVSSAEKMIRDGVNVGQLQKIEELTLYMITLEKRDREQAEKNRRLLRRIEQLNRNDRIKTVEIESLKNELSDLNKAINNLCGTPGKLEPQSTQI